jgi:predicted RNase H-like HicB family nuclease
VNQDKISYRFQIEIEREADGRWIAEIPNLPGVMVYGTTKQGAVRSVRALALRVLANTPPKPGIKIKI